MTTATGIRSRGPRRRARPRSSRPKRSSSSRCSSASSARGGASCSPRAASAGPRLRAGELPDFLPETREIRDGDWRVPEAPPDLRQRRVEITGPVDRKMVINALNSGASVFMADFEDANSPTWANVVDGQGNLKDAVARTISLEQGEKSYSLNEQVRRRSSSVRAAGTSSRSTRCSTASRSARASSTSGSSSSTARARCSSPAAARTSTCRSSSRTARHGSGTTLSCSRRNGSGSIAARFARRC